MAVLMLAAAAIGAQLGTSATGIVDAARIRVLFGIIVLAGGVAVAMEEISQAADIDILSTLAAVVLLGIGGAMCLGIGAMMLRSRRDKKDPAPVDD